VANEDDIRDFIQTLSCSRWINEHLEGPCVGLSLSVSYLIDLLMMTMLNPVVQLHTAFIQDWESLGIWEWQKHLFIISAGCHFWIKVFLVLFWGWLLIPISF